MDMYLKLFLLPKKKILEKIPELREGGRLFFMFFFGKVHFGQYIFSKLVGLGKEAYSLC